MKLCKVFFLILLVKTTSTETSIFYAPDETEKIFPLLIIVPDPDSYRNYRDSRSFSVSPAGLVINEELYGIRPFQYINP